MIKDIKEFVKIIKEVCFELGFSTSDYSFDDCFQVYKASDKIRNYLNKYIKDSIKEFEIESIKDGFARTLVNIHCDENNIEIKEDEEDYNSDNAKLDALSLFLKDIKKFKLLTKDQEFKLFAELREYESKMETDPDAKKKYYEIREIINGSNQRLVMKIANRFIDDSYDILCGIQDGNFGLLRAISDFDHTKGYKFSTYATWWIRQSISREKMNTARAIRYPVHMHDEAYKYKKIVENHGGEISDKEAAALMGVSLEKIAFFKKFNDNITSLNTKVGDEEETELLDFLESEQRSIEDEVMLTNLKKEMHEVLQTLNERERIIITERFGLETGSPKTLEEVGAMFHVTRERIRQIESKALRKLRLPSRSNRLRDYL